jgi:hypothetical protein
MNRPLTARHAAPAREVEYFIDCAQECAEMDACTAMTLRLYGDDDALMPVVTQRFENYRVRQRRCVELAGMADGILERLPEQRRAGLVHSGLRGIAYEVSQLAEVFSNWAIDDAVEGGDMEPFRDRVRSKDGIPFKRTMRKLRSPKFVRRYVKSLAGEAAHLRELADILLRRAAALAGPALRDPSISADWRLQINAIKRIEQRRGRRDEKTARKVILRSLRAATSIIGAEGVSAFLRGEEVRLVGSESILVVSKRGGLTERGHGCLSIGLADRNGTRLADLCTFIEDTPTLDQLAAFGLWMASGGDRAVLEKANVIGTEEAGRNHPLLTAKATRRFRAREDALADLVAAVGPEEANRIMRVIIDGLRRPSTRHQLTYEERRARNDAYWNEMRGHWIEAMMVLIIGYRNFPVFEAAGAL